MFVYSFRMSTVKFICVAALSVAVLLALVAFVPTYDADESASTISYAKIYSSADRVAFISQFGWSVEETPVDEKDVTIPASFDKIYENYNQLQKSDALDFIKRIVQFALQPKSTDKQLALGWRRWLPVGFRTGKIWKMLIAALGYVLIYALCFSGTFTDADNAAYTGVTLWAFRIDALLMLLGCVELIGNYGGVMDRLPLMNKSRLLYMIMTVIYTIVWCFLIISILALVVS